MAPLAGWQNFYVIVGSSAGALIGLQFVVMSVIIGTARGRLDPAAGAAFATPTIIHFGTVLGLSAVMSAPWKADGIPINICGLVGLAGVAYAMMVTRRMRRQIAYRPEFEDWLFHVVLPFAAYVTLTTSAYTARSSVYESLVSIAGAAASLRWHSQCLGCRHLPYLFDAVQAG